MAAIVVENVYVRTPLTSPVGHSAIHYPRGRREEEEEEGIPIPVIHMETSSKTQDGVQQMASGGATTMMEPQQAESRNTNATTSTATQAERLPARNSARTEANDGNVESGQQTTPAQIGEDVGDTRVPAEDPKTQTTQQNGHTVTDEDSHLTLRDEYVDRVWEEFVTNFLLGSCNIQKAAIFDLATRRPLATSGDLHISKDEMEQLVTSLHHIQLAYRNGVTIGGQHYRVKLADGRNGILARTGTEGCTVCKTQSLIIIGIHDQRGNSRKCNEDVMRLGDFFRRKAV
ncbi:uncharacterized protein [Littorina saxatilis]|uniref:Profilin n=1 Tax=Littorina saxatilis TaxID=31220 RepID=A0AAN9B6W6_9CAEN